MSTPAKKPRTEHINDPKLPPGAEAVCLICSQQFKRLYPDYLTHRFTADGFVREDGCRLRKLKTSTPDSLHPTQGDST